MYMVVFFFLQLSLIMLSSSLCFYSSVCSFNLFVCVFLCLKCLWHECLSLLRFVFLSLFYGQFVLVFFCLPPYRPNPSFIFWVCRLFGIHVSLYSLFLRIPFSSSESIIYLIFLSLFLVVKSNATGGSEGKKG